METLLATLGSTGNVAVVEWASNRVVSNLGVRHPRHVGAGMVAFSPEGSRVAIGEDYGRMSLLNWRTGTMRTLANQSSGVKPSRRSRSPRPHACWRSGLIPSVRLWDFESGQPRGQFTNQTGSIRALAFSADGQLLALASSDRTIRVLRGADQTELRCWRGHEREGLALAFLPEDRTLVSGCDAATACFWDVTATHRSPGHASLEISYGIAAKAEVQPQGFTREPLDPKVVCRFGFTFTPDGRSFITTDHNGVLGVWDTRLVQQTERLSELGSNHWGVALSPDGHWLAIGDAAGKVQIWDWTSRRAVTNFALPFEWAGHLRFSRSGRFFWAGVVFNNHTTRFRTWRTKDWQEVTLAGVQDGEIYWADFSPDDQLLAAGYKSGAVKLRDFPSGQHETTFTNQAKSVSAVVFSPDGRMLASTSYDGTTILRDLFAHRELATLWGHSSLVWGAAFSPDSQRLATGGTDAGEAVKLWDLATQRELLSLAADGQFFLHVAFSPDGNTLMATSYAGIAHLWRAPAWAEIEAAEKGPVTP